MTHLIAGVKLRQTDSPSLIDDLLSSTERGRHVHFVNAYSVVSANADPKLASVFNRGVAVADGTAVVWAMRLLHPKAAWTRHHKVSGPDTMARTLDQGRGSGTRHYFLGGSSSELSKLVASVETQFPGIQIAGSASPPFAEHWDVDWGPFLEDIRTSDADIVWVGLGTPKQDFVTAQLARDDARTYCAVGAAFLFLSGSVKRSPTWMSTFGIEWIHRFAQEPRRLWRRYLIGNPRFIQLIVQQWLTRAGRTRLTSKGR